VSGHARRPRGERNADAPAARVRLCTAQHLCDMCVARRAADRDGACAVSACARVAAGARERSRSPRLRMVRQHGAGKRQLTSNGPPLSWRPTGSSPTPPLQRLSSSAPC